MKNFNESVKKPHIPDLSFRILIICGSGAGKTNALPSLKKYQRPHIDQIYMCFKDPFELKHQLLINGRSPTITELFVKRKPNISLDFIA